MKRRQRRKTNAIKRNNNTATKQNKFIEYYVQSICCIA